MIRPARNDAGHGYWKVNFAGGAWLRSVGAHQQAPHRGRSGRGIAGASGRGAVRLLKDLFTVRRQYRPVLADGKPLLLDGGCDALATGAHAGSRQ
jgi:hypothetical protein